MPAEDGPVAPGVVRDGFVRVYFIDTGDGVALIDCGDDVEATAIKAALKARGLDASGVQAIFLTHGHPDHTAGCRQFPWAVVHAFAAEKDIVELAPPRVADTEGHGRRHREDGDGDGDDARRREAGDGGHGEITGWNIPGHTEASAAYLARDSASAEDGDSGAVTRGPDGPES